MFEVWPAGHRAPLSPRRSRKKAPARWLVFLGRTVEVSADSPNAPCFLMRHRWGTKAKPLASLGRRLCYVNSASRPGNWAFARRCLLRSKQMPRRLAVNLSFGYQCNPANATTKSNERANANARPSPTATASGNPSGMAFPPKLAPPLHTTVMIRARVNLIEIKAHRDRKFSG